MPARSVSSSSASGRITDESKSKRAASRRQHASGTSAMATVFFSLPSDGATSTGSDRRAGCWAATPADGSAAMGLPQLVLHRLHVATVDGELMIALEQLDRERERVGIGRRVGVLRFLVDEIA